MYGHLGCHVLKVKMEKKKKIETESVSVRVLLCTFGIMQMIYYDAVMRLLECLLTVDQLFGPRT